MSASWPNINYGVQNRMFNSISRDGGNEPIPMAIPRFKFTWFADIILSGAPAITNLGEMGLKQGHLYTHLKGIDHPKPTFKTETLNSYNRRYKLQTKMEIPAFTMTFHDDTTGFALALQKELINHANWIGGMGGTGSNITQNIQQGLNQYSIGNSGVSSFIQPDRTDVETRPSLGMKLMSCSRTWISHIVIYDLGTEPSSINVYVYQNPFLTGVEHSALDNYDRTGFGEMTFSFEYENFFSMVGQSQRNVRDFVDGILGSTSSDTRDTSVHAQMGSFDAAMDWTAKCMAQCSTPTANKSATGQTVEEILGPQTGPVNTDYSKLVNWEDGGTTDPEMTTEEAIRRGLLTPTSGSIPIPPVDNQLDSYKYLDDRYTRAIDNYNKTYSNLTEDTPQAAIRREEITALGQARNEAAARYNNESPTSTSADTKSAVLNTQTRFGVTQSSAIPGQPVPTNTAPTLATLQGLTRPQTNPPAMSTPTYTITDPAVPFSQYNQNFLRTFKAGVTK